MMFSVLFLLAFTGYFVTLWLASQHHWFKWNWRIAAMPAFGSAEALAWIGLHYGIQLEPVYLLVLYGFGMAVDLAIMFWIGRKKPHWLELTF